MSNTVLHTDCCNTIPQRNIMTTNSSVRLLNLLVAAQWIAVIHQMALVQFVATGVTGWPPAAVQAGASRHADLTYSLQKPASVKNLHRSTLTASPFAHHDHLTTQDL